MFQNYEIAVKIKLTDNATSGIMFLAKHILKTEEAAGKLQARLNAIKTLMTVGAGFMGAGAAIGAPLLYAIDKAAELQKQMIAVQIATRGTTSQMNDMRKAIEGIASQTMFSNVDVAKQAKIIATGTGLNASQVQGLLPAYARYADVQLLTKGTPYTQSVTDAIRAAHGAGHYDPASLSQYLNLLTKASLIVPGSNSEVVRGLAYFQNTAKTALGMTDDDSVLAVALANRLGFGGTRGGTNLTAALTRSIPGVFGSGLLKGKNLEALRDMNMIDAQGHAKVFDKDGKFDVTTWMGLTADFVAREFASNPANVARQNILRDFAHSYGVNGMRLGAALGSPQAIEQWKQLGAQFQEYGGFEAMQQTFADQSVSQQWENAKTNFISAMTELGTTLLPTATKYLKEFNTYMGKVIDWMSKNPGKVGECATNIGKLAVALAGLGIVSTVTGAIVGLATALGLLRGAAIGAAAAAAANATASNASRLGKLGVAGMVGGLAYEAATALGAGKLGEWYAGRAYNAEHPYNPNARKPTYAGNVYLDKKIVGKVLWEDSDNPMIKALKAPQTGTQSFDPLRMLLPAGGLP